MRPSTHPEKLLLCALALSGVVVSAWGETERVAGANATLETQAGTRAAALGGAALPLPSDLAALQGNPQQLADLKFSTVEFAHVSYYEDSRYDYAAMGWPLGESGALGLSISRFGADGIPLIGENDPLPEGDNYRTFSLSDWVVTGAWARRYGRFSTGLSVHALRRELDQDGWGFRADAGMRFDASERLAVSALLKGWTSSAARWESGTTEYSPPEILLGLHANEPVPYLYGNISFYWQSAGLLHRENRAMEWDGDPYDTSGTAVESQGERFWKDPVDWLQGGRAGLEYGTENGFFLRGGLQHLGTPQSWTAGAGLSPFTWLRAEYAYQNHPVLSGVHRVSLTILPGVLLAPPGNSKVAPTTLAAPAIQASSAKEPIPAPDNTPKPDDVTATATSESTAAPGSDEPEPADAGGMHWEE